MWYLPIIMFFDVALALLSVNSMLHPISPLSLTFSIASLLFCSFGAGLMGGLWLALIIDKRR